jgi:competence protein ComEC
MTKDSQKHNKRKWLKWGIAILSGSLLLAAFVYYSEQRKPELEVYFFKLTRGRASFVRTPENKMILIGAGQTSEIIREITKLIPFYRRRLDYVVVPSAAADQIGGLIEIIERYEIGEAIIPKILATSTALAALEMKIEKNEIKTRKVEKGDIVEIEKDVRLNILFPYEEFSYTKSNLPELGMSLIFNSISAYFLGDLSKGIQKALVNDAEKTDIVEYAHSAGDAAVARSRLNCFYKKRDGSRAVKDKEEV